MTVNSWNYVYGPMGMEKATVKNSNNQVILTQDYTLSPTGKILSMTYTPNGFGGSFSGELYFHYDNYGNTVLLTDASGNPKVSYAYDLNSGSKTEEWNDAGIVNIFCQGGEGGSISLSKPWGGEFSPMGGSGIDDWIPGYRSVSSGERSESMPPPDKTEDEPCGGGENEMHGKEWTAYNNCVRNCFYSGDTVNVDIRTNKAAWDLYDQWVKLVTSANDFIIQLEGSATEGVLNVLENIAKLLVDIMNKDWVSAAKNDIGAIFASLRAINDRNTTKKRLVNFLNGAFKDSAWISGPYNNETDPTTRFESCLKLDIDCHKLCEHLVPGPRPF